jgi:hypothetical protein
MSGVVVAENVRAKVVPGHAPIGDALDRSHVLGRDLTAAIQPMRDGGWRDAHFIREGLLGVPAKQGKGSLDMEVGSHCVPTIPKVQARRNTPGAGGARRPANTIGSMKKRGPEGSAATPPKTTPFSLALRQAIRDAQKTHEDVADAMKVTPGLVSAWVTARKAVPAERAVPLATYLGCAPETISAGYAEIAKQGAKVLTLPGSPALAPELAQSRVENDVDALRMALWALTGAMTAHRPAEAKDVLQMLRKAAPARFLRQGFLAELVAMLESRADQPAAAGPGASRRRAKP